MGKIGIPLVAATVLQLVDVVATIVSTQTGRAIEVNPIMAFMLKIHPVVFTSAKFALAFSGIYILSRCYRYRPVSVYTLSWAMVGFYSALSVYHFSGM